MSRADALRPRASLGRASESVRLFQPSRPGGTGGPILPVPSIPTGNTVATPDDSLWRIPSGGPFPTGLPGRASKSCFPTTQLVPNQSAWIQPIAASGGTGDRFSPPVTAPVEPIWTWRSSNLRGLPRVDGGKPAMYVRPRAVDDPEELLLQLLGNRPAPTLPDGDAVD